MKKNRILRYSYVQIIIFVATENPPDNVVSTFFLPLRLKKAEFCLRANCIFFFFFISCTCLWQISKLNESAFTQMQPGTSKFGNGVVVRSFIFASSIKV